MDGRISTWLCAFALALAGAGCAALQNQNAAQTYSPAGTQSSIEEAKPPIKKLDGPKRPARATTEIKFGELKEADADSDIGKKHPEAQARARDDARKAYQAALKTDPGNLDALRHLAKLYAKMSDYERAFDTYKHALAKHPKDAQLWYDLGLCHNRRKEFNDSIRCFNEALKLDPENRTFQKTLGFTHAYRGQIEQGLAILTHAQGAAMAHYNIARVLIQRDQTQQARQHLHLALRENSQFAEARTLLTALDNPNAQPPQVATQ